MIKKDYTFEVVTQMTDYRVISSLRDLWRARLTWLTDAEIESRISRAKCDSQFTALVLRTDSFNVASAGVLERLNFDKNAHALMMAATAAGFADTGLGTRLLEARLNMAGDGPVYVTTQRAAKFMTYGFREIDQVRPANMSKPLWTMYRPRSIL